MFFSHHKHLYKCQIENDAIFTCADFEVKSQCLFLILTAEITKVVMLQMLSKFF